MANFNKIRETFDTFLTNNYNQTYISWDNVPRDLENNEEWIRPTLALGDGANVSLGDNRIRYNGLYIIQVFAPINEGTGRAYRIVDFLTSLFDNQQLEANILTYASEITRVGDEGNGWYQINISIPFTADKLSTD